MDSVDPPGYEGVLRVDQIVGLKSTSINPLIGILEMVSGEPLWGRSLSCPPMASGRPSFQVNPCGVEASSDDRTNRVDVGFQVNPCGVEA